MTSEHGQAPIYKLDSDILHEIFKTNTVTEFPSIDCREGREILIPGPERRPLTITLQTSHVCKQWRDIILQSSIIWGRCIDFNVMEGWNPSWRSLVFERAKESLLSITASRDGYVSDPLFLEILAHHWGRIQQLDIFLSIQDFNNASLMELLCRPALSMSFFRVDFHGPITSTQHNANLLSIQAPSLVFLSCPALLVGKTPRDTLHVPSSKIRYLNLDGVRATARNLLETCLEMPHLEVFRLRTTGFDQDDTTKDTLPRPYFPKLSELYILTSSFDVYSLFMDQIIPAYGCSVHTRHKVYSVDQISHEELDNMQSTLLRYSQSFLDSHQECTNISLRVHGDSHTFKCDDRNFTIGFIQAPVNNAPYHLPLEVHSRLLDNICSLKFPARTHIISNLDIIPGYHPSFRYRHIVELPTLLSRVIEVLDSMKWASYITLAYSHSTHRYPWIVLKICLARFPALTSLKIGPLPDCAWFAGDTVTSALVDRQKRAPLQLITLKFRESYPELDMRFMNNMPGLTVTWTAKGRTVYHKCGVDDPEQLNLRGYR